MILQNGSSQYEVGDVLAEAAHYRIRICTDVATGTQYVLQVAIKPADNGGLDRAAYVLRQLKQEADLFETEYAKRRPAKLLSYDRLFPQVVDSFVGVDQGGRRVNILAFTDVDSILMLAPLSNLASRDNLRVELSSSAWIMDRLLKLLGFAHGKRIAVNLLDGNNILLEPSRRFAVVFDWSSSQTYPSEIPATVRRSDISSAAKSVLQAIGADASNGSCPHVSGEDLRYVQFIWSLATRQESDAIRAQDQLYVLVEELYGHQTRPFQTLPR